MKPRCAPGALPGAGGRLLTGPCCVGVLSPRGVYLRDSRSIPSMAGATGDNDTVGATHHVYIVVCSDGTYYTGYTTDVERRVAEHNAGEGAKYTRGRRPVELVHVETYDTQSTAMQREYAIKQLRRAEKERLIG